ncbi:MULTISPECIES: 50S ribosomal protein L21 [Roseovarius]|uniref:50S ribosomal protein L21 n=1 Tax=Roseovarius TaxID=74030 RepID=UPI001C95386B|nr:50S ribosomal protein L21 [Roseovarius atlanticus]MBY5988624.1 50S ribosomal protein L21 [Roseovarius atlanticus]MBY6124014.1 50S ribosomal protein L21 [Roseovarius atlanticus]MBY6148509.1 50S ribosomal protein L21 [Roseovarius atlanticus]
MFAVLKTGGKQYKVQSGDMLRVEKLAADAGEKVQFNEILMLGGDSPVVGVPLIEGAAVQAEVVDQIKGDKVINFVKRRRKHGSQRTRGHRQQLTLLRVTEILEKGADKSGVKAAVGASALAAGMGKTRYADNKAEQAEMAKRVKNDEAKEKSVAKKAEPKAEKKAEEKKAAPKKAAKAEGGDDLKKLSGVGPALEKKLHEAGVTTFAQIAAWTADDIAEMDEKLSFKGRIEREGWVEQAKELAKG